jgi:iron complex transport system substrate-binding protein
VALLRRLGVPVVQLPPPSSLADVETQILAVGAALGREAEADGMVRALREGLADRQPEGSDRPRAALYSASGWTGGRDTLAGEVLDAAGFSNVAVEAGLSGGGYLRLEQLLMLAPDLVVTGTRYPGHSRSEEILDHPVLDYLHRSAPIRGADWVCGTPHLLRALDALVAERAVLGR